MQDHAGDGLVVRVVEHRSIGADDVVVGTHGLEQVVRHVAPAAVVTELHGIDLQPVRLLPVVRKRAAIPS
jgi:hypothetical protein